MARIEESIDIKCPIEKAFTYTTDAKSWPKWQTFIPEAEQTSPGKVDLGTTFKGTNRMMGMTMKWTAKTNEYQPTSKWGKKITAGSMNIQESLNFNPLEGGTKFTIMYDMNAGGLMKLFSPMIVNSMRKETKKSLINLKRVLEE